MQLSQLFRRGVVRPLDDSAAQQLSGFAVHHPVRVEWLPILGDDQFADIWNTGILQRINQLCGTLISDYEEVVLPSKEIYHAIDAIRSDPKVKTAVSPFFESLELLLLDAMAANQSVYFVF